MVNIMKRELNNFIIEGINNIDYFDDIVNYITENEKEIFSFFRINKLSKKCHIQILNYDLFKKYIINKYGDIKDYIRADTDYNSYTINILDIDDQIKYTTHKEVSVKELLRIILHEMIHICHDEINHDYSETIWFYEGIATNLSKQDYKLINLDECDFDKLKIDFGSVKNNYKYAYTIVNYIINNCSSEEVYKLCKDSNYLRDRSNELFKKAKESMQN